MVDGIGKRKISSLKHWANQFMIFKHFLAQLKAVIKLFELIIFNYVGSGSVRPRNGHLFLLPGGIGSEVEYYYIAAFLSESSCIKFNSKKYVW